MCFLLDIRRARVMDGLWQWLSWAAGRQFDGLDFPYLLGKTLDIER
jgi:hypothetical protein